MEDIQPNNVKPIIVIGAGGHAAEIDDYLTYWNLSERGEPNYFIKGFLDDNPESYQNYRFSAPFLGKIETHQIERDVFYIIGIANIKYRRPIIEKFLDQGARFETFIHPTAMVSRSSSIFTGSVIAPNVNIGPNVKIGQYNMINARASIGHDSTIGNYNFITPNVCFSGFTTVGDENMFGINSATIPNIVIGSNNTIAAGMIVDKNIENDSTVFHRFKEKVMVIKK